MSNIVPLWWWWTAEPSQAQITVTPSGGSSPRLLLPEPPARYSQDVMKQMQLTLEQQDALVHKRTGDMYHPYSMVVRQRTIYPWVTFDADDATPSVLLGRNFKTANANATTVTDFDDGTDGQEIVVRVDDAVTTFDFTGESLVGNGSSDLVAADGDTLRFVYDSTEDLWYCTGIQEV